MTEKALTTAALEAELAQLKQALAQRDREAADHARVLQQRERETERLRGELAKRDDLILGLQRRVSQLETQRNLAGAAAGIAGLFALRSGLSNERR